MKYLLLFVLLLGVAPLARAQRPGARGPVVMRADRMRPQLKPGPNRPDVAPAFPGGQPALSQFIQDNVQTPAAVREQGKSGIVFTSFTVGEDGRLRELKVDKGFTPDCDAEALRLLGLMPAWKPATRKGQPVAAEVTLAVPFGNSGELIVEKGKVKFE
ncbi:energy transducer TonB [Hymenobacter sp. B81]|uniref:energy transducer TonB n=1 Tax=Hymenobacter sp. B81 TaxID=3344878 RepID=UPI0037DC5F6B